VSHGIARPGTSDDPPNRIVMPGLDPGIHLLRISL
jgi:hypothetical protein